MYVGDVARKASPYRPRVLESRGRPRLGWRCAVDHCCSAAAAGMSGDAGQVNRRERPKRDLENECADAESLPRCWEINVSEFVEPFH